MVSLGLELGLGGRKEKSISISYATLPESQQIKYEFP